ncbi:hypothetical protein LOTGIDRAFT_238321 [Lottia gigantea]|uniref:Transporter n=2 Tax=Lottia gigantea TaxID=225164 RepID=V4B1L3_LOTGI|nr:hypothetical protein LOTGIDRAFT_238321 [Lottia gigantea]ESP01201.1 hypothetical protein LOTGIDRAFT_238321 [Lottia gigantea]
MSSPGVSSKGSWGSQLEFILTSIGCAVGLGNVWRFPYLTYTSGGGAFLVPYFICLVLIGIPLFCIDISFGQFTSLGAIAATGRLCPIFKGLGMSMVCIMTIIMLYYSVVIATCFQYLFASLTSYLPWSDCLNEWNTCNCRVNKNDTGYLNNTYINCDGYIPSKTISAGEEYYTNHVLGLSPSISVAGSVQWRLCLSLLFTWFVVFLVLIKGVKSIGKAVYVFTILPYILLTVLLIRGVTLTGYQDGIAYYLNPKVELLAEPSTWSDAAVQIFYSTSTSSGALIAMSSFNSFKNNTFRDSLLIPIVNALTSFYGGFATFAILGFMANEQGVQVPDVTTQGPGLAFVVYPEALSKMPVAPLWSFLFFLMMVSLGISSMLTGVETFNMSIMDAYPKYLVHYRSYLLRGGVCCIGFLLGIAQITQGGSYITNLLDTYIGGFPLLVAGLFEIIVIIYIYGHKRFSSDIVMMVGENMFTKYIYKGYFVWCWLIITPAAIFACIISKCIDYESIVDEPVYPGWSGVLGWFAAMTPIALIPGYFLYYLIRNWKTQTFREMFKPAKEWGPFNSEHREGIYARHVEMKDTNIEHDGGKVLEAKIENGLDSGVANEGFDNKE